MSVIVVVEQDGERLSLHFDEIEHVHVSTPDEAYTVIGVDSIRVAEALEGR